MSFDLPRIVKEVAAAPLVSPYPSELSVAVVSDAFRMARLVPPPPKKWKAWLGMKKRPLLEEQLGMLGHFLAVSSLREETVRALPRGFDVERALERFFEAVTPLTAEMIRANAFRQDEFLRNWIACVGGTVEGEKARESQRRLETLDYRKTLAEYERADQARKAEAEKRAKALKEAADREAAARGWRE